MSPDDVVGWLHVSQYGLMAWSVYILFHNRDSYGHKRSWVAYGCQQCRILQIEENDASI